MGDDCKDSRELQRQAARYRALVEHSSTAVLEYDYNSGELFVDPLIKKYISNDLSALSPTNLTPLKNVVYLPDVKAIRYCIEQLVSARASKSACDVRLYTVNHTYEWFRVMFSVSRDDDGTKQFALVTLQNINEEVTNRKKLEFLVTHDPLTKILSKDAFENEVRGMVDAFPDTDFIIIRMDIERFHMVNQLFGQGEGDKMLKFIAVRIQEAAEIMETAVYGRLAADQFAICVPYVSEQVREMMDYLQTTATQYPLDYEIVLAFGLYVIDDRTVSVHTMLDRALQALKTIKGQYERHYAYHGTNLLKEENEEHFILNNMERAIYNQEFHVFLQPKVNTKTGELVGAEALVRWVHPERGIILPGAFIPVFERNGFITKIDYYVWEHTCMIIRRWLDQKMKVVPVSVNLSLVDVYNPKLSDVITQLVDKYLLPHELIEFEITESSFISDAMLVDIFARSMRSRFFKMLMDDFGSGYSSLNSLKDIDVDVLKLDMRFLSTSIHNERGLRILEHIVQMAKSIDIAVIAEGVETEAQRDILINLGCDYAQGFLFGRPAPVDDYERDWLSRLN